MYSEAQNCLQEPLGEIHATSCGIRNTLHIPRDMYEHNTCQRGRTWRPPSLLRIEIGEVGQDW